MQRQRRRRWQSALQHDIPIGHEQALRPVCELQDAHDLHIWLHLNVLSGTSTKKSSVACRRYASRSERRRHPRLWAATAVKSISKTHTQIFWERNKAMQLRMAAESNVSILVYGSDWRSFLGDEVSLSTILPYYGVIGYPFRSTIRLVLGTRVLYDL